MHQKRCTSSRADHGTQLDAVAAAERFKIRRQVSFRQNDLLHHAAECLTMTPRIQARLVCTVTTFIASLPGSFEQLKRAVINVQLSQEVQLSRQISQGVQQRRLFPLPSYSRVFDHRCPRYHQYYHRPALFLVASAAVHSASGNPD